MWIGVRWLMAEQVREMADRGPETADLELTRH